MNTIVLRIADFLKNIPPFSFLTNDEQLHVAQSIKVEYFDVDEDIFPFDGEIKEAFYLVKEGAVGLYSEENKLSDECDEGDIFGLRALIRKDTYKLAARAIEESIVYSIPSKIYNEVISKNADATAFIAQNFANNLIKVKEEIIHSSRAKEAIIEDESTAKYSKNPITCSEDTSIKAAAQIMTVKRVGSIIVTHQQKPIGIITDKDLRTKIATGKFAITEKVIKIMSAPVICYPETITVAEAQIAMLKNKITHLCITKDGTDQSEVVGLLSEHDIILIRENNPSVLIKAIKRAFSVEELVAIRQKREQLLQRYLQQKVSIVFITKVVSEINNALTSRAISIAIKELKTNPPVPFAWVALGSQGRKEQVLLTDQDNAIVFKDHKDNDLVRAYFLSLAKKVTHTLNRIGFEYCPADMMASNERWCLSVSEWSEQYRKWISTPTEENVMFCTIFFDFQTVYGDSKLSDRLMDSIQESMKQHPVFLKYLGKNALQNPAPLGFFRQFLVEQNGEHKDKFDIKARAMMPLVDGARILTLDQNLEAKNTLERFTQLIQQEPQNEEVYSHCYEAFKMLLLFRTQQGFEHKNSGRFINLSQLNKVEKLTLKDSFKALKELQTLLQVRFQLSNFM
jgi:CBS domain-containing protein